MVLIDVAQTPPHLLLMIIIISNKRCKKRLIDHMTSVQGLDDLISVQLPMLPMLLLFRLLELVADNSS
jgi:hypothetical protein